MLRLLAAVKAIQETPRRIADAWLDPIRRVHSISRIAEGFVPALIVFRLFGLSWPRAIVWAGAVVLGEFVLYEWVLEPLGLAGYYWERGPRDDEIFVRP